MKKINVVLGSMLIALLTFSVLGYAAENLVWSESFETGTVGEFPVGWSHMDSYDHNTRNTGFRIVKDVNAPDGDHVIKYTVGDRSDNAIKAVMEINIPEINQGRFEFSVFQPEGEASNWGIKPYRDGTRLVDFWFSGNGDLRLPGRDAERTDIGTWLEFAWEWNVTEKVFHVYQKIDEQWVQKSPVEGFALDVAPNKIYTDGNTIEGRSGWGLLDNLKLYNLAD